MFLGPKQKFLEDTQVDWFNYFCQNYSMNTWYFPKIDPGVRIQYVFSGHFQYREEETQINTLNWDCNGCVYEDAKGPQQRPSQRFPDVLINIFVEKNYIWVDFWNVKEYTGKKGKSKLQEEGKAHITCKQCRGLGRDSTLRMKIGELQVMRPKE